MFDGAHLTLLIGPLPVPIPAPLPVMEALQRVEINSSRDRSGFQVTFSLGKTSPLQLALLPAGFFDPMITRVVIIVTFKGIPNVLMDGVVTRQEMQPGNEPGQSTLTITGEDLSILMDVIELRVPFVAMPEVARINLILAKYAAFGVVPIVVPPPVVRTVTPAPRSRPPLMPPFWQARRNWWKAVAKVTMHSPLRPNTTTRSSQAKCRSTRTVSPSRSMTRRPA